MSIYAEAKLASINRPIDKRHPLLRRVSKDPNIRQLYADGVPAFWRRVRDRILAEHRGKIFLNRCPKCGVLARTRTACVCPACNFTWFERRGELREIKATQHAAAEQLNLRKKPRLARSPRPLPVWVWILSALFLPYGVFIAYGFARLLSWPRSIALALSSAACVIVFVRLLSYLDEIHGDALTSYCANAAAVVMEAAWVYALYRIGRRANYWSPATLRGWRIAGWFAVALFVYMILATIFMMVISRLQSS